MRRHTGMEAFLKFRAFVVMASFKLALAHTFLEMGLRGPCKFEIYAISLSSATSGASLRIEQHSVDAKILSWPQGVAVRWCHPFVLGLLGMEGVHLSKRFHFQLLPFLLGPITETQTRSIDVAGQLVCLCYVMDHHCLELIAFYHFSIHTIYPRTPIFRYWYDSEPHFNYTLHPATGRIYQIQK